ncbi:MAG: sigma-70 family RNA polymerase sigma factor [Chloroflexi bacterium]|nr:sigma-70 family RNA polymerase sigma factor [Chloroflexota bacterium]
MTHPFLPSQAGDPVGSRARHCRRSTDAVDTMTFRLHDSHSSDFELASRVAGGDGGAFATLDARHRRALTRYAGSLLRRSEHDAEDVVQDVLIRALHTLRSGQVPDELRPWLYRLTRNRAIDEIRRTRWGDESLEGGHTFAGDTRHDPDSTLRRRESIRRLVEDLEALPVRQRTALIARELDGHSFEQVAAHLGVSVSAAQKLALRARENLVKTRDARDTDCDLVRAALRAARERRTRPTEHGLRHLKGCDSCRAYQRQDRSPIKHPLAKAA